MEKRLRRAYEKLNQHDNRILWPGLIGNLSICGDQLIDPIRCVGNNNIDKAPAFPRMHNKFLVFGNINYKSDNKANYLEFVKEEVWTGSYNMTINATNSLENALLIKNNKIADAYYNEFCQIFALSEKLDWTSNWSAPEFRIGT